ncbi:uncharacterized protein [Hyperolius riggenbachi]|uniref:uncharacterized protein isoform X3 n=1 Tax=Hyperolius riggenbachi TaxID=752182 RepID=UPI0035A2771F
MTSASLHSRGVERSDHRDQRYQQGAARAPLLMVNFRAECKDCYKEDFMEHYNLWCSFNEMMNPKPEAIPEKKLKAGAAVQLPPTAVSHVSLHNKPAA